LQVKYFCPGSCPDLAIERPRDLGCKEFGQGSSCEDLLKRKHVLWLRGEDEDNSSDVRRHTGCVYFSIYDECIEVVRPPDRGNFGPEYRYEDENNCEVRMKTGCLYYGGEPCVDVPYDEAIFLPKAESVGNFGPRRCEGIESDLRTATGVKYFSGLSDDDGFQRNVLAREESLFGPDGVEGNNSDIRTWTGKEYFRPISPEVEVVTKSQESEFGFSGKPANTSDIRRETGEVFYGPPPGFVPKEEVKEKPILTAEHGENTSDMRTDTGCKYYSGGSCNDIVVMRDLLEVNHQLYLFVCEIPVMRFLQIAYSNLPFC